MSRIYGSDWRQQLKALEDSEPGMDVGTAPSGGAPPTSGGSSAAVRTVATVQGGDVLPPPSSLMTAPRGVHRWADYISRDAGMVAVDEEVESQFSEASWSSRSNEDLLGIINSSCLLYLSRSSSSFP